MIGLTPRQLEVFTAVAATGSARAAAQRLHLTQPAVSMALAGLERQLDTRLFDRDRGRLHLNPRGRELLPAALEVLERLRDLPQQLRAGRELGGELRLGTSNTVGNYLIGDLLGGFVAAHPGVAIQLSVDNTRAIVEAVRSLEVDVGCVEGPVSDARLDVYPWREDRLAVCVRPDDPLTRRRRLRPADFADTRWILREPGSAMRRVSEHAIGHLPPVRVVLELGQVESIKQAVMAGLGIACLPEVAIADAVATGRLQRLATPFLDLTRRMSLVLHRTRYRSAAIAAFVEAVTGERPSGGAAG